MRRKNIKFTPRSTTKITSARENSKRKPDLQNLTLLKQRGGMVMEEDRYTYPYK